MKRIKGIYIRDTIGNNFVSECRVPVWVYEIVEDNIFPVKFEYMGSKYKGLRFSERKNKIIFAD